MYIAIIASLKIRPTENFFLRPCKFNNIYPLLECLRMSKSTQYCGAEQILYGVTKLKNPIAATKAGRSLEHILTGNFEY